MHEKKPTEITVYTYDHPVASGRSIVRGDKEWRIKIPLSGERTLVLCMGQKCRDEILAGFEHVQINLAASPVLM